MDASISYFIKIIEKEIHHSIEVFKFLKQKELVLINNNNQKLKSMFEVEHQLFIKTKDLEEERLSMVEVLAARFKIDPKDFNLSVLAQKQDDLATRGKLIQMRKRFIESVEKVKNQNFKCEILIKKSLEMIDYSMRFIARGVKKNTHRVYNRFMKTDQKKYSRYFVDQKG